MTNDVERFAFLLRQLPVCTQSPVKLALGGDLHRELRAKYKLELGIDLLEDRCPNVFNCRLESNGCIGRPFPIDNDIYEALMSFNCDVTIGNYKGKEVYLAKSITCVDCPFKVNCDTPCVTQESYLKSSTRPDLSPKGPMLVNFEDFEAGMFGNPLDFMLSNTSGIEEVEPDTSWLEESLPLDCLSDQQRLIVEGVKINGRTHLDVGHEMGIDRTLVTHQLEASMNKLKEFGKARKYLKSHGGSKRVRMYYIDNLDMNQIAGLEGVNQSNVSRTITNWRKEHDIITETDDN